MPIRRMRRRLLACWGLASFTAFAGWATLPGQARAEPLKLKVIGGLSGVNQYRSLEEPFWRSEFEALTGGRATASIAPFDASGMRAQDMLQLIRLGVAPFGTVVMSVAEAEDPEINAVDLAGFNPDLPTLRRHVAADRDHLTAILSQRYGVKLLAVYAYPAQVLYCAKPFSGFGDLKGRTIRTSSVTQSDLFEALGAKTVVTPFAEIVPAIRKGVVDCAVTGTLSGNENGLAEIATHLSPMAINWGLSIFAANEAAWLALPPDIQAAAEKGISGLEKRIWEAADADTVRGIDCNIGRSSCPPGQRRAMQLVPSSADDERLRGTVLESSVLPHWIQRCGDGCASIWSNTSPQKAATAKPAAAAGPLVRP